MRQRILESATHALWIAATLLSACGGSTAITDGGALDSTTSADAFSPAGDGASSPLDGGASDATTSADLTPVTGGAMTIGEWTDAPGACPSGVPRVDITTGAQLASASRGEDAYVNDAPGTCYFIHNGTYANGNAIFYVLKGGVVGGARRYFIGESRSGVVINGRGTIEDGVTTVTISNLTFDLTGYSHSGSFNTLGFNMVKDIIVDHVTFTGDCKTGSTGAHLEFDNGADGVLIDSCIIEKFGNCNGDRTSSATTNGHLDHGVYISGCKNVTIRNSVIRGNSSRGIQMYTQGGQYGTDDQILIERNRIYENGHGNYEDGAVINASGTGPITHVTMRHNLIYRNYYSGVRFAGGLESTVLITNNTFDGNGAGSTSASRSEINIDDVGGGSGTSIVSNIFNIGNTLINDCYDGTTLGFSIGANFVHGSVPSGATGNCVAAQSMGDPQFVNAAAADYHPQNTAAASFGAYAP